jgi:catechol 2,3-dioxygenase-like lactoylglutathione lyase family enzyme
MITHLDAVELAVPDLAAAIDWYTRFLGVEPALREDGAAHFGFAQPPQLCLTQHASHRLRFAVPELARATRRLKRLSIDCGDTAPATAHDGPQADLPREATGGVAIGLVEAAAPPAAPLAAGAAIAGFELVLLSTADRLKAMAFYGAVLGLELRLDQALPGGHRLQQYPCGGTVVEVTQAADQPPSPQDELIGIGWKVADIEAAHARLQAAGFVLSEVRRGFKPGTQTFTVREVIGGLRFIVIQP